MYNTIVVGTDGSRQAEDAIRRAGQIARCGDVSRVHVVTAREAYPAYELERLKADVPAEFHDVFHANVEAANRFGGARAILRSMNIDVDEHEVDGHPATGILDVAESVDADLIVVGARGLGAIRRFLRGSVSTRVAHHSPCDVLVVEHDHDDDR